MKRYLQTILLVGLAVMFFAALPVKAQVFEGVPTATPTPFLGANWKPAWNDKTKGYELYFYWTPVAKAEGYSIAVSKKAGASPRKEVKTLQPYYRFKSVSPGQWYVNLIVKNNDGSWTEPAFWTVNLIDQSSSSIASATPSGLLTVTPSPDPDVLSMKTKVQTILRSLTGTPEEETPISNSPFNCNKACEELSCKTISCNEAYYQLYHCSCKNLDSDSNGVPCENKCAAR